MTLRRSIVLLALAAFIGLGGCTNRSARDHKIAFDIAGPVAIDVESFNGDVRIFVDEQLKQATVRVKREANFGRWRGRAARRSLADIQYTVELASGPTGPVLQIRTWTDHAEAHYQRAHVTIDLPAVDGLRVATNEGRVVAVDAQGETDITTERGNIRYMSNLAVTHPITLRSQRGHIDFRVRGESAGHITAATEDGEVDQRILYGRVRIPYDLDRRKEIVLNDGQIPINLITGEGDVRIAVVHNPTDVGWFIVFP